MNNTRLLFRRTISSVGEGISSGWPVARMTAQWSFTGKVRNHNTGDNVAALSLEHYPGMTEKSAGGYCHTGA